MKRSREQKKRTRNKLEYLGRLVGMRVTKNRKLDEREKLAQAVRDARDMFVVLPDCPDCGGKLLWMDREMKGGIRCVGHRQEDEQGEYYWDRDNSCGFWGYSITPVGLAVVKRVPISWRKEYAKV